MDSLDGHWTYTYDDIGQLTHAVLNVLFKSEVSTPLRQHAEAIRDRRATSAKRVSTSQRKNPSHTLSPRPLSPTRFMPSFQSPEPMNGSP